MSHADRVVLVTGGAAGIGAATAQAFANAGARVWIADRDGARADALAKELRSRDGDAAAYEVDVTDDGAVADMIGSILAESGRLDVACNNAGRDGGPRLPFEQIGLDTFDRVMAVNVRAVFVCMQHELAAMRSRGSGTIVNMCSISGLVGTLHSPVYAASKHAVAGLTKSAALEAGAFGVRVNAVAPGIVRTEMVTRVFGEGAADDPALRNIHPLGRLAEPDEIAASIVWLASDAASFVTGAVVPVDGGFVAR